MGDLRFDGVIKGFGGCPMAQDNLVGNMPSENLIHFAKNENIDLNLNLEIYNEATLLAQRIFQKEDFKKPDEKITPEFKIN